LAKPQRLKVGFTCEDEVMLLWNQVPSADHYKLYSLGEKYLEPILLTTDTFAILQKNQLATQYITQVPVFSGIEGSRELTINYETQGTGCYFISFIPRELITDSEVIFDVLLGTVYNLREVVLERWNGLTFEPVELPSPVSGNAFSLQDASPVPGNVTYRAKLTTVDGDVVYSNPEQVLVIRDEDCYLYPNPLSGNQELNIVINDVDLALIQIMDLNGRVIREAEDFGPVKTINTIDMVSGTYLVRIQRQDGRTYIQKLVVIQ
ncbi:MAG: T9SS type A sorting domain-containing protein, partial [Cyclobacteriaceae bacterium]|nr:T9SS type A sorting domain-containing protein [Cyclobacteriaceae bacterium]